jgi:hypothetical protein
VAGRLFSGWPSGCTVPSTATFEPQKEILKMVAIFPPSDPRAGLSDTVGYLKTIGDDAARIAGTLVVHHKKIADHEVKGKIHRLKTAAEDFGHAIRNEMAAMSAAVRAAIERPAQ